MTNCPDGLQAQFFCAEKQFRMAFVGCNCDGAERLAIQLGMLPEIFEDGVSRVVVRKTWNVRCECGYEVDDCNTLEQAEETAKFHMTRCFKKELRAENTGVVRRKDLEPEQEGTGDSYLDEILILMWYFAVNGYGVREDAAQDG